MPDEPEERESDLTSLADMWGKPRKAWPPEQLAPGVVLRRIPVMQAENRRILRRNWVVVPYLEDPRPFYAGIALRNYREEDEQACSTCRGAKYVRYERPPGHILFGKLVPCRSCFAPKASPQSPARAQKPQRPAWYDRD